MFNSKQIKKAWKIRKEAAVKFGCGVMEISWKECLKMASEEKTMKEKIIELGGKEWVKNGMDRVYISCEILNILLEEKGEGSVNFSASNNKIFFDTTLNAVMRSYKGKKPKTEIQY
jgi:hypothetical protein